MENMGNSGFVSQDKVTQVVTQFGQYMSSGDAHEVLAILGDATKIGKGIKLVIDFRNWHITRKIRAFVETLDSEDVDKAAYRELCEKNGKDKVLAEVLVRLDRFSDETHAEILAHLMSNLLDKRIEWQEFITLNFCLELLNPQDIKNYTSRENLGPSFIAAGLAYITYTNDGGPRAIAPNGKRFNKFYDFGLKPYLDNKRKGAEL